MVGYEMNLLLSRTASPYRSLELVRRCANMVVGSGGVVKQVQNHGIRPLGYKIRQNNETHTDAHYISFQADMNPRVVSEMQHSLKLSDICLRWMTTKNETGVYQKFRENSAKKKTSGTSVQDNKFKRH